MIIRIMFVNLFDINGCFNDIYTKKYLPIWMKFSMFIIIFRIKKHYEYTEIHPTVPR